jgi:UDP-N-acetyl-D-galactosamine dehydrogenase
MVSGVLSEVSAEELPILPDADSALIAVIGLGYVGLPLAVEFGKKRSVIGFDVARQRIEQLSLDNDSVTGVSRQELESAKGLSFTGDVIQLAEAEIYIVTVPTPIYPDKTPDLRPLLSASEMVGSSLRQGNIVIFESTVYPGATEDDCVPVLEQASGLKFNLDFYCGYSPERINPGDDVHKLTDVIKVTSGSTPKATDVVDALYRTIISAGTFRAASIRVAEAAKVIENTQRDVNIALINELSMLFTTLGINTSEVLAAAQTKWNFLPFKPGLVGGHCIGVDPYYLTHKARQSGFEPALILSGRKTNDGMPDFIVGRLLDEMERRHISVSQSQVLVLGATFKENCNDVRNSLAIELIHKIKSVVSQVKVFDPLVDIEFMDSDNQIRYEREIPDEKFDAVVIAVAHDHFRRLSPSQIESMLTPDGVLVDLKNCISEGISKITL